MPSTPYELVSGPVEIFTAPVGTAAPDVDETPGGDWVLLGTSGDKDYGEDGVTITPEQTIEYQYALGSTAPQKAFRTQEGLGISVPVMDLTAETLAKVMNGATVTDVAAASGTPGYRTFDLMRGLEVDELSVLIRGFSPYADNMNAQYRVPRAIVENVGEYTFQKGEAASYEVEFTALEHSTDGFGEYEAQDASAL